MKYLKKNPESEILKANLKYVQGRSNADLRRRLLEEQHGYCAYSEQRVDLDETDVEHFNAGLKNVDNYYNYYAVHTSVHRQKTKKERTALFKDGNAQFFKSLFFQTSSGFKERIGYFPDDYLYEERDLQDHEAQQFIDFLSLNESMLVEKRKRHIERLLEISEFFDMEKYLKDQIHLE